jgi:hypothetical protein
MLLSIAIYIVDIHVFMHEAVREGGACTATQSLGSLVANRI